MGELPDGLGPLPRYTIVSFKSIWESFDLDAVLELVAHFVNHRKQVSPVDGPLRPQEEFRVVALTTRYPDNLTDVVPLEQVSEGVYVWHCAGLPVWFVVVHRLPLTPRNAPLLLFSDLPEQQRYAAEHYKKHPPQTSTLIDALVARCAKEEIIVPTTVQEYVRKLVLDHFDLLPPEELVKRLSTEQRLPGLPPEELAKKLSPKERVQGLSAEDLRAALDELQRDNPPTP